MLIREVSQQRIAIPHLVGSEPLELLLEIGLEKLIKDYEFIFTESKICSAKELNLNSRYKRNIHSFSTFLYASSIFSNTPSCEDNEPPINVRKTLQNAIGHSGGIRKTLINRHENNFKPTNETIGFSNSTFSPKDVERKLSHLSHTHLALEHLLLMQINLNLESGKNFLLS